MTDLRSELKAKWREAEVTGKTDREWRGIGLSVPAVVQLIAGIREPDNRIALLLEAPIAAAPRSTLRMRADGVSLADQRRPDEGIYRLAITLEHEGLRDVFEVLAQTSLILFGLLPQRSRPLARLLNALKLGRPAYVR